MYCVTLLDPSYGFSGVPRGEEGAIRPGRHSEMGGKKRGNKEKKQGKAGQGKKGKRKKKKIWETHAITVKLKWNILAAALLCT